MINGRSMYVSRQVHVQVMYMYRHTDKQAGRKAGRQRQAGRHTRFHCVCLLIRARGQWVIWKMINEISVQQVEKPTQEKVKSAILLHAHHSLFYKSLFSKKMPRFLAITQIAQTSSHSRFVCSDANSSKQWPRVWLQSIFNS